jgi:hypothetical protein
MTMPSLTFSKWFGVALFANFPDDYGERNKEGEPHNEPNLLQDID